MHGIIWCFTALNMLVINGLRLLFLKIKQKNRVLFELEI